MLVRRRPPTWRQMQADTAEWAERLQFDFFREDAPSRKLELAGDRAELRRRVERVVARDPEPTAWGVSIEDLLLSKLELYELGARASDRQWRDVIGVLKVRKNEIDLEYLRRLAPGLGVSELLELALNEVGFGDDAPPETAHPLPRKKSRNTNPPRPSGEVR